jgi:Arginosuccinate synthase
MGCVRNSGWHLVAYGAFGFGRHYHGPGIQQILEGLALEFARLRYNGFWFAPEMDLIRHPIDFSQRDVEGTVELELYKGVCSIRGRSSPKALYNADLASMDMKAVDRPLITIPPMPMDSFASMPCASKRMRHSAPKWTRKSNNLGI